MIPSTLQYIWEMCYQTITSFKKEKYLRQSDFPRSQLANIKADCEF